MSDTLMSRFRPPMSLIVAGTAPSDLANLQTTLASYSIRVSIFPIKSKDNVADLRKRCVAAGEPVIVHFTDPLLAAPLARELAGLTWIAILPENLVHLADDPELRTAYAVETGPLRRNRLLTTIAKAILAAEAKSDQDANCKS